MPISKEDDGRLLWLQNEFCSYIKNIQDCSIAARVKSFTGETYNAPLFSTRSTVEAAQFLLRSGVNCVLTRKFNSDPIEALFGKLRFMCGGNDALDARAVTAASDHIVQGRRGHRKKQMNKVKTPKKRSHLFLKIQFKNWKFCDNIPQPHQPLLLIQAWCT